jgi:two-component system cell cycle sensor histidine kinase/response regulator CckA
MAMTHTSPGSRILIVDDNATIHQDIRKILCPPGAGADLLAAEQELFGAAIPAAGRPQVAFEIDSAYQGQEALARVEAALLEGRPYAMAFVDVRMPPGWDGIETIRHIWAKYPELQVVICTAYSDHSWDAIVHALEQPDSFVILKKPFDNVEVLQLAHALTKKWSLNRQARLRLSELKDMVARQTAELSHMNEHLRSEVRRREQTEIALRGSEHRFHLAFKASSVPMGIMHASTRTYLEVNDAFLHLTGRDYEEIVGSSSCDMGMLAQAADCERVMEQVMRQGRVRDSVLRIIRKGGEPRDTLVSLEPVVLGEERCLLVAVQDVTEQRKLEGQLRQSQKMEAIGQLAAGVAHDFNNLLTIIHGHASLLANRPNLDDPARHSITQVKMAADRAATLTRQLLAFSRKQVMQPRALILNDVIEKSHGLLKRLLGETIRLECVYGRPLPPVFADENSLDQVLMNLTVNARDAMPGGGTVSIRTEAVTVSATDALRNPDARAGQFVRLSVKDDGCGMDTSLLARIFEPFFTTKPQGKGTGLGLSTVYGIVKQHEGWMEVQSLPGMGSTFSVLLPVTDKQPEPVNDTSFLRREVPRAKAQEVVLVVEDEPVLRDFITMTLEANGYTVLQAGDGMEALQVSNAPIGRIDLLLTDMVMPNGMTGAALAVQLSARIKDLRVLYTSGYSQELMENADRLTLGVNFLPKPFDVNKLLRTVRACLESPVASPMKTTNLVGVPPKLDSSA